MRHRRLIIALAVLLALGAVTTLLWAALDWPPPRLILKYGPAPPTGGPTGRTWTNNLGMEFVEINPGYARVRYNITSLQDPGGLIERVRKQLQTPPPPIELYAYSEKWAAVETSYWISEEPLEETLLGRIREEFGVSLQLLLPSEIARWVSTHSDGDYRAPMPEELILASATKSIRTSGFEIETAVSSQDWPRCVFIGDRWAGYEGSYQAALGWAKKEAGPLDWGRRLVRNPPR